MSRFTQAKKQTMKKWGIAELGDVQQWQREYLNSPLADKEIGIVCRCGWRGIITQLQVHHSFEQYHSLNKKITKQDYEHGRGHITEALRCPQCKRWYYADGKPICGNRYYVVLLPLGGPEYVEGMER